MDNHLCEGIRTAKGNEADELKLALERFMRAKEGSKEQSQAFEGILRCLASCESERSRPEVSKVLMATS